LVLSVNLYVPVYCIQCIGQSDILQSSNFYVNLNIFKSLML